MVDLDLHYEDSLDDSPSSAVHEFLVFSLGDEAYATRIADVRKIVAPLPLTPVPRSHPAVLGVCSVRGELATVYDLRLCLGIDTPRPDDRFRVLLVESAWGEVIGFHVDDVRQVARLTESQIEPATEVLGADVREHWIGVSRADGEALVLIDLTRVLREGEL
jgi:chemotaxis signal transduction protein